MLFDIPKSLLEKVEKTIQKEKETVKGKREPVEINPEVPNYTAPGQKQKKAEDKDEEE